MLWSAVCILLISAYVAKRRLGTIANPITFMSFGLAAPLCARAVVDSYEIDWERIVGLCIRSDVSTHAYIIALVMVIGGWLAFCLPWISELFFKAEDSMAGRYPPGLLMRKTGWIRENLVLLVTLLLIAYASNYFGYLPIWKMLQGELDVRELDIVLHQLPLGIMAMIAVMTMIYVLDTSNNLLGESSRTWTLQKTFMILFLLFLAIWNGKRQVLLFAVFVYAADFMYRWDRIPDFRKGRFSPYALLPMLGVALAISFIAVDHFRYSKGGASPLSMVGYISWPTSNQLSMGEIIGLKGFELKKLKQPGLANDIHKMRSFCNNLPSGPQIFASDYLSSTEESIYTPSAEKSIIQRIKKIPIPFVLTELLPSRLGGKDNMKAIRPVLYEQTSPSGFFAYWWLDGGLPFVLLGGFLFGSLSLWLYRRRLDSDANWKIYILVLWAAATSGVYSHFIALIYFWLPLIFICIRSFFRHFRHV